MIYLRNTKSQRFITYIGIALAIHILVLSGMNVFNRRDHADALMKPSVINLDTIVSPRDQAEPAVRAVDPTRYTSTQALRDHVLMVLPDLGEDTSSLIRIVSSTGEPFSIIIEDTHALFTLTAGGSLVGQNISPEVSGYSPNRAYTLYEFSHAEYVQGPGVYTLDITISASYRTSGMQENAYFLIGSTDAANRYIQRRLMTASMIFGGFVLLLIASVILLIRFRAGYILATTCMSLVMALRFILLGEYPVFGSFQLYSHEIMFLADYFLAVLIFLLSQLLAISLFRITLSRALVALYSILFVGLEMFGIIKGYMPIISLMHIVGIGVTIHAASSDRSDYSGYSLFTILTYSLFSASITHQVLLYQGLSVRGASIAMMFTNQFSALLYIGSILYAVIMSSTQRLRELEQKQQAFERSILLRGISHDLKLPISVIKLRTQMRSRYHLTDEESRDYDEVILQATGELEEMAEDINAYMHAVSETDEEGTCQVREQLGYIAARYANFGDERGISFHTELDTAECLIATSPLKFERMLCNLIDNAFTYSEPGGTVKLRYSCGKQVLISVEDEGIGMDERVLELIMKPFYRLDASRNSHGSGLGLTVVKAVAESLNAELSFASTPGKGTRVTITIPGKRGSF